MVGNINIKNKQNSFNHLQLAFLLHVCPKDNTKKLAVIVKKLILPAGLVNEKSLPIHTAATVSLLSTQFHTLSKEDKREKSLTIYPIFLLAT